MSDFKISRLKYTWKGQWSAGSNYLNDDIVRFGARIYVCITQHTADDNFYDDLNFLNSDIPPSPAPRWVVMVESASWQGRWTENTYYTRGAVVKKGAVTYFCVEEHISAELESDFVLDYSTNNYWIIYSSSESWKTNWTVSTLYNLGDVVVNSGRIYKCIAAHVSSDDPLIGLEGDSLKWQLIYLNNIWKGDWQIDTIYYVDDIVKYGGTVYRCISQHLSAVNEALGLENDQGKWAILYDGIEYAGAWSQAVQYKVNDVVKYGSYLYKCTVKHTTNSGQFFDSAYWTIFCPGFEYDQEWASGAIYQPGDIVRYGGYLFIAKLTHLGEEPTTETNNFWNLLFVNSNIRGDWTASTSYQIGDVIRRQGQLYIAKRDVTLTDTDFIDDGSTINTEDWELMIPGSKWQGQWDAFRSYVIGDLILWRSGTYRCIAKHVSSLGNRPNDEAGIYWEKYTYSDERNILTYTGDIKTYGLTEDGSTIGATNLTVGNQGQTLQAKSGSPSWETFNSSAKVYYVATDGVDSRTTGTSQNSPWRTVRYALDNITGPATVFVKNGMYEEILPLRVPSFVAVVGDELRGTIISASDTVFTNADASAMLDVIDYLNYIIEYLILEQPIGTTEVANPAYGSILYGHVPQDFTGTPGTSVQVTAARSLLAQIRSRLATGTASPITGTNALSTDANVLAAAAQLLNNSEFLESEMSAYIAFLRSSYTQPPRFIPDVVKIVNAVAYDLKYPGNYESQFTGTYFYNSKTGSENRLSNMFLMKDGTGLRNCTLTGLSGTLGALNVYLTRRPTAGAYASLDPGYGPADTSAWVGTKSPYIQNVTTFGTACIGLKIDGDLHDGGNQTIVANDFTQVLSDGIGVWCNGTGKTEVVSVFTYYNHVSYLCTDGGKIRGTNGNSSYGQYGAVAEGFDLSEVPITAVVNNRYYDANVDQVFAVNGELTRAFFSHAGNEYTQATYTLTGAGINGSLLAEEFRDGAVYEVRIKDPGDSSGSGGGGYANAKNNAQSGDLYSVTIAGSDDSEADSYRSMRLVLDSGTGTGQYGYIAEFNETTKNAFIASEFKPQQTVASTTSSGNRITIGTTEYLKLNDPVLFTGVVSGNIQLETIYYVKTIVNATQITVSDSEGGTVFLLINSSGGMIMHHLGWNHFQPGTTIEPVLDTTTYYSIEPRVTFSSTGYNASAISLATPDDWISITYGSGKWVAVANGVSTAGSNAAGYSSNGTTWTATNLPTAATWVKVAYGDNTFVAVASSGQISYSFDGVAWNVATAPVETYSSVVYGNGLWVATSTGGKDIATSPDAITWTAGLLPEGADWIDITYGKGKFVAVSQSDSSTAQTAYSTDGTTWTLGSFIGGCRGIAYGNNRFVAIEGGFAGANSTFYSFDGITWTPASIDTQNWQTIKYFQGTFVALAESYDKVAVSTDGINWAYRSLSGVQSWRDIAGGGIGKLVAVSGLSATTVGNLLSMGTTPQARVTLGSGRILSILLWEVGSGYSSAPVMTLTDPNNTTEVTVGVRVGNGVLGTPSIVDVGEAYQTLTTGAIVAGDGYKDQYQTGKFLVVDSLTRIPGPGDNLNINGIDDYTYKVLSAVVLGGTVGDYTAQIAIAKTLGREESPEHDESLTIRQLYSQVRLTGHDFLDVGLGNFEQTNYPNTLFPVGTVLAPENEVVEKGGGRVFYSSTDQDGNFRVGEVFAVEQSTGTVTISADFFVLEGLEELSLGGVSVGGSGVVIREFSTDPLFIADSNNIVPTQRAVKAYLSRRVSGGGSDAFTTSVVAGVVRVGPTDIGTTTSEQLNIPVKVNFKQPFSGDLLTNTYFLAGRGMI